MFSPSSDLILVKGNLLESKAHALVNTVNCVGVMGKGVALHVKKRYPAMFQDYVERCNKHEVELGKPYPFQERDRLIINFPTKQHWRRVSRLRDIEDGLDYLRDHLDDWGVQSLAVPPLGCGNGQLDWSVVGPTLVRYLETFNRPVELYVPHGVELDTATQMALFPTPTERSPQNHRRIPASFIALVEILRMVEAERYHWPVGRIMFQKLAYFATAAGIPTELIYEPNSYGPYASDLKKMIAALQNNGLVAEHQRGKMLEVKVGLTFNDARTHYVEDFERWANEIWRVTDLMTRFNTSQAEIAATVHYVAENLKADKGQAPLASDVIEAVEAWKIRRRPPLRYEDIGRSLVSLATQGWIDVIADESIEHFVNEFVPA